MKSKTSSELFDCLCRVLQAVEMDFINDIMYLNALPSNYMIQCLCEVHGIIVDAETILEAPKIVSVKAKTTKQVLANKNDHKTKEKTEADALMVLRTDNWNNEFMQFLETKRLRQPNMVAINKVCRLTLVERCLKLTILQAKYSNVSKTVRDRALDHDIYNYSNQALNSVQKQRKVFEMHAVKDRHNLYTYGDFFGQMFAVKDDPTSAVHGAETAKSQDKAFRVKPFKIGGLE